MTTSAGVTDFTPKDVGIAFALVILAGCCTGLGSVFVLFSRLHKKFVAASLGLAAGVMTYIALVEIYAAASVDHFTAAGIAHNDAFTYATLSFAAALPVVLALDWIAHRVMVWASRRSGGLDDDMAAGESSSCSGSTRPATGSRSSSCCDVAAAGAKNMSMSQAGVPPLQLEGGSQRSTAGKKQEQVPHVSIDVGALSRRCSMQGDDGSSGCDCGVTGAAAGPGEAAGADAEAPSL
eukprot:CAMPEP_0202883338 /NCGR_PEP_ID=MMETSP1391-20130828/39297_1 /ASSEMBLY_ACC=CAM_ASM_000867 /TAXON_ID=1034604 /ORGANISM="Chlamydomonas leiostraca, Strain SAG 11-49" /LENGTH=235 /DNA_ID=CAMNT_0049566333 /DNA_START=37 /DNA_END=741 /DNA_ORIENTATION=-